MAAPKATRDAISFVDEICARVSGGETLNSVCADLRDYGCPASNTFRLWVTKDEPKGIAGQYARAREMQWEHWGDQILDESQNDRIGEVTETDASGAIIKVKRGDATERARLAIDAKKWLLSKLVPKKYGDKVAVDQNTTHHAGDTLTEMMAKLRNGPAKSDA